MRVSCLVIFHRPPLLEVIFGKVDVEVVQQLRLKQRCVQVVAKESCANILGQLRSIGDVGLWLKKLTA
jgi:hypothetical protein